MRGHFYYWPITNRISTQNAIRRRGNFPQFALVRGLWEALILNPLFADFLGGGFSCTVIVGDLALALVLAPAAALPPALALALVPAVLLLMLLLLLLLLPLLLLLLLFMLWRLLPLLLLLLPLLLHPPDPKHVLNG